MKKAGLVKIILLTLFIVAGLSLTGILPDSYAASVEASGTVDAQGGAYIRDSASTSGRAVAILGNNTRMTIIREVFCNSSSTKAVNRWYYVSANGHKGYIRADLVDSISYSGVKGSTTDSLNYRTGPATSFAKKGVASKGAKLKVLLPASLKGSSGAWYKVRIGSKNYYLSGRYISFSSRSSSGKSVSRSGASEIWVENTRTPVCVLEGKGFTILGNIKSTDTISTVRIGVTDKHGSWIISKQYNVNDTSFDIFSADSDITFGILKTGTYRFKVIAKVNGKDKTMINSRFKVTKNQLKAGLLGTPTSGGKARYVYTFAESNCTKLFSISGFCKAVVPQAMTFTGSEYYIVYGMNPAQAIVTYSATGEKLRSGGFAFNIGHPNGITYDPQTGLCYVFKGHQKRIYTWNPETNKYGKSSTPYSSSGVAYDKVTKDIYASSQTGIRVYSADGKFTHKKLFSRCYHGIKHYIQDCGAHGGFIFHGISGSNKQKTNFLDIYRAEDSKYLGSIRITIGEIESVVVGNDGYVQLLVNTPGRTDYVWKTPLNIKDLKL